MIGWLRTKLRPARPGPAPSPPVSIPSPPVTPPSSPAPLPHHAVAARAAAIWDRKGRPHGQDEANWLEAEAELRAERGG